MTLIKQEDAIEAIQNAYCKPCKEQGDDYNEIRCRACEYDNAIIQIDALPSAETHEIRTETHGVCLISKDDAIDAVCKCAIQDVGDWAMFVDKAEAILALNALPSAEAYFTDVNKIAEWIPCSERLPRTGDDILVTFSDGEVDIIISARPKAWVKYEEANNLIFPVAWMPLPEPYRKDDET